MPKPKPWSTEDMPSMEGKLILVTGATAGLGLETSRVLLSKGATVILGGRNEQKATTVIEKLLQQFPSAKDKLSFGQIDLGSLASVRKFAEEFNKRNVALDVLINNAGMSTHKREVTEDGHEIQFQTNHLAHFALTALLLPSLRRSNGPRVVNLSSGLANQSNGVNFEDLMTENGRYVSWKVYSTTKLQALLFTNELQRKSDAEGWGILAVSVHPGYTRTDMTTGETPWSMLKVVQTIIKPFGMQEVEDGAKPSLFAASAADVEKGGFYGPTGFLEMKGAIGKSSVPEKAKNKEVAEKLWNVSCELSAVVWS